MRAHIRRGTTDVPLPGILHSMSMASLAAALPIDDVQENVEGARAAGLHAVLVDRTGRRPSVPPGTHTVTTLAELPAVVDAIGTAP